MNSIAYEDIYVELPSKWDELTPKQYVELCGIASVFLSKKTISDNEWKSIKEATLVALTGEKPGIFSLPEKLKALKSIPSDILVVLTNEVGILDWVFAPIQMKAYHLPHFKIKGKTYYGPTESMTNVTTREFIDNHIDMMLYERTEEVKYLMSLLARLYRPKDAAFRQRAKTEAVADMRELNDPFTHTDRIHFFKHNLSTAQVAAMFCQYAAHMANFMEMYPNFWPKTEQKKKQEAGTDLTDYFLMNKNLAGQVFGTMKEVDLTPADIFFKEMDERILDNKFNKK